MLKGIIVALLVGPPIVAAIIFLVPVRFYSLLRKPRQTNFIQNWILLKYLITTSTCFDCAFSAFCSYVVVVMVFFLPKCLFSFLMFI